jgi:hypothetical protein
MNGPETIIVNKRELAHMAKVAERTVDRWIQDGCPIVKGGSNGIAYEFDLAQVLAWRQEIQDSAEAEAEARQERLAQLELTLPGGNVSPDEPGVLGSKEKSDYYDSQLKFIKLETQRGSLLERADVEGDYQAIFGLMRQRLIAFPMLLKRVIDISPDQVKAVDIEVRLLLRELAQQIRDPAMRPTTYDNDRQGNQ